MTKLDEEQASNQKELDGIRHKSVINRNVGIGSYIAMFGGIILGTAASIMASPLVIGVVVAGNVIGAASLILNGRLDGRERKIHGDNQEKAHLQNMLQIRKDFAEEKLKAEERRQESVKEDFNDLVKGVDDSRPAEISINEQDLWLEVDGIRLQKHA